jgi:hypothetical protein
MVANTLDAAMFSQLTCEGNKINYQIFIIGEANAPASAISAGLCRLFLLRTNKTHANEPASQQYLFVFTSHSIKC